MRLAFVGIYLATGKIVYTRYSQSVRTIKCSLAMLVSISLVVEILVCRKGCCNFAMLRMLQWAHHGSSVS